MSAALQAKARDIAAHIEEARQAYAGEHASGTLRAIGLKFAALQADIDALESARMAMEAEQANIRG